MKYQIVVARYNENILYLTPHKNITIIYNKGLDDLPTEFDIIKLPNIGRESHTYLYHIIQNYDNLADKTFFIQGKIDDHRLLPFDNYFNEDNLFIGHLTKYKIDFIKNPIKHNGKYINQIKKRYLKKSKYTPYEWLNMIGINIKDIKEFSMVWGAIFSLSKEIILKKPKNFYEYLIKYVDNDINPEEGHFFERSWYLIFNHPNFLLKNKIYYKYITYNIDYEVINNYNNLINNEVKEIHLWTNNLLNSIFGKIKFIFYDKYINIYPNIINNIFYIKINGELNLLIELENKRKYNVFFTINNIYINNISQNINILKNEFMIKVTNNCLFILDEKYNTILEYNTNLIDENINIISVKIKGNALIDYINKNLEYNENNIFLFYSLNYNIIKNFYRDNYENYYIEELLDYPPTS